MRVMVPGGHWTVSFQPSSLGSGGDGGGEEAELLCALVGEDVEDAAVEDLEAHQVEVHGVGVLGEIDELPDLGGVEAGLLGDGLVPVLAVEQHDHGVAGPCRGSR